MATDAAVTVDSSTTEILASMNPKERAEWRTTGKIPDLPEAPPKEPKEKTEAAPSTAATTEVTEPPAKAAKEPTESAPAGKEHKPNPDAEARIKGLLAENKVLEAKVAELSKRPEIKPAKIEEVAIPRRSDVDSKTGLPLYATDEAYLEARDKAVKEIAKNEARRELNEQEKQRRRDEADRITQQRWLNSIKIAHEKFPDWATKVGLNDKDGKYQDAALKSIKEHSVLDAWILDSEIGAVLLYHFAGNQAEVDRFQSMSAFTAARELTKLEDKLSGQVSAPPKEKEEEKPAERSDPSVTKPPAPATSVGGKSTAPTDEVDRNVKTGDFKGYREAANREEALKRKAS